MLLKLIFLILALISNILSIVINTGDESLLIVNTFLAGACFICLIVVVQDGDR